MKEKNIGRLFNFLDHLLGDNYKISDQTALDELVQSIINDEAKKENDQVD